MGLKPKILMTPTASISPIGEEPPSDSYCYPCGFMHNPIAV